jgi:hypothetical protein
MNTGNDYRPGSRVLLLQGRTGKKYGFVRFFFTISVHQYFPNAIFLS